MKYHTLFLLLFCSLFISAQDDLINKVKDQGSAGAEQNFAFEILHDHEATPVRNQGRSATCWSYATTGLLESELLRLGKEPIDLSEMFTVRHVYQDKAERYVRLHGHLNFAQGGASPDVLYVLKRYGAVPQSVYSGLREGEQINNHGELEALLKAQLDAVIKNKNGSLSSAWPQAIAASLDAYLGAYPAEFEYRGKRYTPRSFADDFLGLDPDDYVSITSFSHHPFYEKAIIQVPDNWSWSESYNLPLDEFMATLQHAVEHSYSVSWATDVSEKGFSLQNALAIVPATDYQAMSAEQRASMFAGPQPELAVDQALRQKAYDNYETTDDHGMLITGMAKDQQGGIYYIVKNSWGMRDNDLRPGYIFASEAFVRYKSISILLHKDGVPKSLRKKLGID